MQIKADFTREDLMQSNDVLFEACHPLGKLKAVASLLYAYPEGPFEMDRNTIDSVANMIEDAMGEIKYLIEINNEQQRRDIEGKKDERPPIDTLEIELAPVQRQALNAMVDLTGKSDDSLAQIIFDHGFETWDSLARLIESAGKRGAI